MQTYKSKMKISQYDGLYAGTNESSKYAQQSGHAVTTSQLELWIVWNGGDKSVRVLPGKAKRLIGSTNKGDLCSLTGIHVGVYADNHRTNTTAGGKHEQILFTNRHILV